jgi:hypothetical protein
MDCKREKSMKKPNMAFLADGVIKFVPLTYVENIF